MGPISNILLYPKTKGLCSGFLKQVVAYARSYYGGGGEGARL